MPNHHNINSPVALIGYGRSGTSLLFQCFKKLHDYDCVGEAGNLTFTTWRALEQISGLTRYGKIENKPDYTKDAALLVRRAYLQIFESKKADWMFKPIGTPRIMWDFDTNDIDPFVEWYWLVFNSSFPKARKFGAIRHPNDVFLSARKYWGYDAEGIWHTMGIMFKIMAHENAQFDYLVQYEDLVATPEVELRSLMSNLGLDFDPVMLEAFDVMHVQAEESLDPETLKAAKSQASFSRKAQWDEIPESKLRDETFAAYEHLLAKFQKVQKLSA